MTQQVLYCSRLRQVNLRNE